MTKVRRRSAALVLAVALGTLSACGGSDDDGGGGEAASTTTSSSAAETTSSSAAATTESSPAESVPAQPQALAVSSIDFGYEMDSTDLAAGEYEITLTNTGNASHDVVVEQDGAEVARSQVIGPGETSTFTVALEPGSYVFFCSVGNHRAMGMEVDVTVS
ncbi:cupredoxin domain-containing protein [Geodermatophilus sp. SYSU D00815]